MRDRLDARRHTGNGPDAGTDPDAGTGPAAGTARTGDTPGAAGTTGRNPLLRTAARLRLTTVYVALLTATAAWLASQSHGERARFVRHNSSNVHHMEVGKWWTMFTSGLVVDGVPAWAGITAVAVVLGAAEWRWGPARAGAVFLFGHLGATLLTEGAMWAMLATRIPGALSHARDVGISYGLVATATCLLALGPARLRRYGLPVLALALASAWALDQELADAGHLVAFLLGVLASRTSWVRARARARAPR
ncbi:rhomboid-like protein [Streptomyces rubellomurinus]|uniref:rhomboid-like protein n=1 Tax=Streptomyces rubellomurinus (strain ATCC 31215) TaxID=359131 RepID=UPI000A603600|nr:rhomboid-like protein [Streptomyces rubellomurinus]